MAEIWPSIGTDEMIGHVSLLCWNSRKKVSQQPNSQDYYFTQRQWLEYEWEKIRKPIIRLLNESHSIYVDNTKVLGYAIVDTTICITVDT